MLSNIRSKQLIITGTIAVLIAFLFTRDIKGLVKPKEASSASATRGDAVQDAAVKVDLEEISATAKRNINANLAAEIGELESQYKAASENEKIAIAQNLAKKWHETKQAIPSALYLELIAKQEPSLAHWLTAGDRFLEGFDNTRDSVMLPVLLQKANLAFKNAVAIDSTNNEAKTGLGITIVNGMGMPMQGIAMLMEVVRKDPKNLKANMSLGTFAIKSGQFDKAIIRFKDIVTTNPSPEAYFYLGTAYENLDRNKEAINAYVESKKLAADPKLSKFIDDKVLELKSKN